MPIRNECWFGQCQLPNKKWPRKYGRRRYRITGIEWKMAGRRKYYDESLNTGLARYHQQSVEKAASLMKGDDGCYYAWRQLLATTLVGIARRRYVSVMAAPVSRHVAERSSR